MGEEEMGIPTGSQSALRGREARVHGRAVLEAALGGPEAVDAAIGVPRAWDSD